jgi:hypothetical protein
VCDAVVPVDVAVAILSPKWLNIAVVKGIAFPVQTDFKAIEYSMKWLPTLCRNDYDGFFVGLSHYLCLSLFCSRFFNWQVWCFKDKTRGDATQCLWGSGKIPFPVSKRRL